jgi:D-glycero-alpha-D-manno-heptose-7-phosphate kinase
MIVTKTPLRISFAGGGTDLEAFYSREYGAVVSASIEQYVYIALHTYCENKIMLKYSKTEIADDVDHIQHPLIRECMRIAGVDDNLEIASFADITSGTGLGSSSSFAVGLIKALYAHRGKQITAAETAELASTVEIERLHEPIGKQDQYAAAYGGLNHIRFNPDGSVTVTPIALSREQYEQLQENMIMFYTGVTRSAGSILAEQRKNTISDAEKFNNLRRMRTLADELHAKLQRGEIDAIGEVLHKGWLLKRELATSISNSKLDEYYERGIKAGAVGGKVLGAGGGGFLLFYCKKDKQQELIRELSELRPYKVHFDTHGSQVLHLGPTPAQTFVQKQQRQQRPKRAAQGVDDENWSLVR